MTSLLDTTTGVTNEEYDTWFSEVIVISILRLFYLPGRNTPVQIKIESMQVKRF